VPSIVIAFLWGLAEATLFFIVPDVYLGLVALFNWRRGAWATAAAVAGAMVGGAVMYALAANNSDALAQLLTRVPLVSSNMVSGIGDQMRREGLLAMVTGPLRGIPYKVYAVQAGAQQLPFWLFLLFTISARLERLLPVTCAFSVIGVVFKKIISRRVALVLCAYGLMWLVIYVLYYLRFR
jgi:membrane protein YqaA with SNARE-associated domain